MSFFSNCRWIVWLRFWDSQMTSSSIEHCTATTSLKWFPDPRGTPGSYWLSTILPFRWLIFVSCQSDSFVMSQVYFVPADLWSGPCDQLWDNGNDGLQQNVQHAGERRHCELVVLVVHFIKVRQGVRLRDLNLFFPTQSRWTHMTGLPKRWMDWCLFTCWDGCWTLMRTAGSLPLALCSIGSSRWTTSESYRAKPSKL